MSQNENSKSLKEIRSKYELDKQNKRKKKEN